MATDEKFDTLDTLLANELASSAVDVQTMELTHDRYAVFWLSVEQVAYPTFRLRDIYSSQGRSLVPSMRPLAFDYRDGRTAVRRCAKCNRMHSAMEVAVPVQGGRNFGKEGFKMILLDGRDRCSSERQPKVEGRHEWT